MGRLILKVAEKHKDWINIVKSFGCNSEIAEDIVQEMYIYIIDYEKRGINIWYNDVEVNYYYIYKQLKGIYVAYVRSQKNISKVGLEEVQLMIADEDSYDFEMQYEKNLNEYKNAIKDIENDYSKNSKRQYFWYIRDVFEIIAKGKSVAELSRDTKIGYYSLYHTYNKIKEILKKKIL